MKPIAIDDIKVMNLGLGRSISSPAQLEEFAHFQESQGPRHSFLAECVEREPTTAGLEDSGAQVCKTWPLRV